MNSITVPVNPETPIGYQDRTSPYSINMILSRQVLGEEKMSIRGLLVDSKPNSPNLHNRNCIAHIKENY